jgi:hypothetical protein
VRGAIVGPDLSVINLIIVKKGPKELPGMTDDPLPKRLGPKRANKIRKLYVPLLCFVLLCFVHSSFLFFSVQLFLISNNSFTHSLLHFLILTLVLCSIRRD